MKNEIEIRTLVNDDWKDVLKILNSFTKDSYAAYSEKPLTMKRMKRLIDQVRIALIVEQENEIIGFGYISRYNPALNFDRSGVLTYFILPEHTGKGLGTKVLNELISRGTKAGITSYIAHISSKNQQSINFHKKHGFEEAGRFKNMAKKFNELFDVVWMQKEIKENDE